MTNIECFSWRFAKEKGCEIYSFKAVLCKLISDAADLSLRPYVLHMSTPPCVHVLKVSGSELLILIGSSCVGVDSFLMYSIHEGIRGIALDANDNTEALMPITGTLFAVGVDFHAGKAAECKRGKENKH